MKSVLKPDPKERKCEYPYLGIADNGKTVLFTARDEGTVVYNPNSPSDSHEIGYTCNSWAMSCFKPYSGEVVLSND